MKYLKTYENNSKLKKYIIREYRFAFSIFEVNNFSKDEVLLTELYTSYKKLNGKIESVKNDKPYLVPIRIINKNLVYQSDNLQDCLDALPKIGDINKYNL